MPTSLVTGATAGLGAAFARQLARRRHDLILVARDAQRLETQAKDLRDQYGRSVEVLPADLTTDDGCAAVTQRLAGPPVDFVVNNAGIGLERSFLDNSIADEERLLNLNVLAVLRLTHAALVPMVDRGRGAVINVSSVAGFAPQPGASYAASKAWVTNFSESMALVAKPHGVRVMALCPGFVRTEFHARANMNVDAIPDWLWLDADDVVTAGLRDLARGKAVSVPSLRYKAAVTGLRHTPLGALRRVSAFARRKVGRDR